MRGRLTAALVVAAVAIATLSGCTAAASDDFAAGDARPLTSEEAQDLATMRLRNQDTGARAISFSLTEKGSESRFDGWYDYASVIGYGRWQSIDPQLLLWNTQVAGTHPASTATPEAGDGPAPLPIPDADQLDTAWAGGALDPSGSRRDALLAVIAQLGADRPDNPLLLQQGGALWLGTREVDGETLTVYAGPESDQVAATPAADPAAATVRYWLDSTSLLRRLDVRLGGATEWTTVTFADADGVSLPDVFTAAAGTTP
ncbi:hypothetical protein [Microbacterium binotii]|uniref:hypothetical protein n=1 Tax=Microbacterium binotii TaxID=462710 RepID=UPI001F194D5A|nr:hypothetical protein [Microbacterium binotii]UIN30033.1 hypothetical protein LXM64_12930 [Microbacterium binotii]